MPKLYLLVLFCIVICPVGSAEVQSHKSLQATVVQFLKAELKDTIDTEITLQPLDRRLRLHKCSIPLQAFRPLENRRFGKVTVGVRCVGEKPWKIFVGAHIHIYKHVWISKQPLTRNKLIGEGDIRKERRDITKLTNGFIHAKESLAGMEIKRNIQAGQAITRSMLATHKLVKRGDRISIVSKLGGIVVRANGVALSDGAKGDRIRVKNIASKREIEAYVSDKQQVLVAL